MTTKQAQCPLILRYHRLMEAFAKSNDERDFYIDTQEGFLVYADLSKTQEDLDALEQEIESTENRYVLLPKLTFYESKKIMEGFVHEKVYDIDTKEKLMDIISSREARENYLDFIYDNHAELEKWQQFYQERSRIRIIEWLRDFGFDFVFEEDLEMESDVVEQLKHNLFEVKVSKELAKARETLKAKAKTYYSSEALNPRPKRGRPPKQVARVEVESKTSADIYTTVPKSLRPFLFTPDITSASSVTFSSKFSSEEELFAAKNSGPRTQISSKLEALSNRLNSLRSLSTRMADSETEKKLSEAIENVNQSIFKQHESAHSPLYVAEKTAPPAPAPKLTLNFDEPDEDEVDEDAAPAKKPKAASKAAPKAVKAAAKPAKAEAKPVKAVAKTKAAPKAAVKAVAKPVVKATKAKK